MDEYADCSEHTCWCISKQEKHTHGYMLLQTHMVRRYKRHHRLVHKAPSRPYDLTRAQIMLCHRTCLEMFLTTVANRGQTCGGVAEDSPMMTDILRV